MVKYCSAMYCNNSSGSGHNMHVFPKDPAVRTQWIEFVRTKRANFDNPSPTSQACVCCSHFTPDCYASPLMLSMGIQTKRILNSNAVPTIQAAIPVDKSKCKGSKRPESPSTSSTKRQRRAASKLEVPVAGASTHLSNTQQSAVSSSKPILTHSAMAESLRLTIPSAKEQRQIIASLETGEESVHVYAVTKTWYELWRQYVGLSDDELPKDGSAKIVPGELDMDRDVEDNNMFVDEKIWKKWVEWYGVSIAHELDRRNWASDEKDFELCVLSPYSGILGNPTKTFDISEETGYVELQLRRIFHVGDHRATRLWACEKTRHARFIQLLDRSKEICNQDVLDRKKGYILALEIGNLDGTWDSYNPGIPLGKFDKYTLLVGRPRDNGYWEKELSSTLGTVFGGISHELTETITGIVKTTKCITQQQENDLDYIKEKLEIRSRGVEEVQKTLNKKAKDILQEEDHFKSEHRRQKREREAFEQEKTKFHDELKRMEQLNRINETKVKLNIGGHIYMTSTLTLVKDTNSMLAAMFSGRHTLQKEEDGSYFIDRDGTHFRFILNFLRDGGFREGTLPTEKGFLNELLTEAEFYQVGALVKLLSCLLRGEACGPYGGDGSDNEGSPKPEKKQHVTKRAHRKVAVIK